MDCGLFLHFQEQVQGDLGGQQLAWVGQVEHVGLYPDIAFLQQLRQVSGLLPAQVYLELLLQAVQVAAPDGAQAGEQVLVGLVGQAKRFPVENQLALLQGIHVAGIVRQVILAGKAIEGMGAGAQAQVMHPFPVIAVVPGLEAGAAEIGYLVLGKALLLHPADEELELPGHKLIFTGFKAAFFGPAAQGRFFLYGQGVAGYVLHLQVE